MLCGVYNRLPWSSKRIVLGDPVANCNCRLAEYPGATVRPGTWHKTRVIAMNRRWIVISELGGVFAEFSKVGAVFFIYDRINKLAA